MSTERFSAPPRSMPFPPGTMLAGKYRIDRLLGQGGMGWVVVATHVALEQRVAIKFMHPEQAIEHPDAVARFVREAKAAARIQSDYVARVSDVGTLENGSPYLVMEFLEGHDLEAELQKGRVPMALAIDYAMQACEGLAEAHAAGIVHRDLKPGNLFLARRTDGSVRMKLLDFGISKLVAAPGATPEIAMTSTQALMGSPLYMSPEQLRSSKNVDRRADIWSMGVIAYEMLGGRAPFDGDTLPEVCARIMMEPPPSLRSVQPDLPDGLDAAVMRCLEKEPERRYPDVGAFARALAPFGTPEARAAAERIARVAGARASSATSSSPPSALSAPETTGEQAAVAAVGLVGPVGIAQTNASFTTAGGERPARRPPRLRWVVWAGAVVAVGAVAVTLAITRGAGGSGAGAASAIAPSAPVPVPVPAPLPAPAPETATATAAPSASSPAAAPARSAAARPSPRPKPATPTPAPTAKPAGTAGFGGRD